MTSVEPFHPGPIPDGLATSEFRLEPLTRHHVEVDYAAVMSSRELLREWSGTSWPEDGFTLKENLDDLERHEREHRDGDAFTYTVLGDEECLGCVYATPLGRLFGLNPQLASEPAHAAVVGFWVVEPRLADGLEERLFAVLRMWFGRAWSFPAVYFSAATAGSRQPALFEGAGLPMSFRVRVRGREGDFGLYRLVT